MKVGDYVRTKSGYLRKIIAIYNNYVEVDDKCFNSYANVQIENDNIKKSSSNIIDLIEVGDYVNGYRVDDINENLIYCCEDFVEDYCVIFEKEDIKSILTKEQFSQMQYKVGE